MTMSVKDSDTSFLRFCAAQRRGSNRETPVFDCRHKFTEPKILALVLIHLGSMKSEEGFNTLNLVENQGTQLALMWIGDSVLQFLITEQLIARYNTPDNYQLHEARVSLANRRNCAK